MLRFARCGVAAALRVAQSRSYAFVEYNVEDPLLFSQQLTEEERQFDEVIKKYAQEKLMPRVTEAYRHGNKCDKRIYRELGELGALGPTIQGYGCAGTTNVAAGLIARQLEYVDSAYRSNYSVQSSLVMHPINEFGSDAQKERYLPKLATGEMIGCFGLTEPNAGSDPGGMTTKAAKTKGGYILNGAKTWITASPISDIAVVWAKDAESGKVKGFICERGMKGFETPTIHGKLSLRASETGGIELLDCFVPDENVLPKASGLRAPFDCLSSARFGIAWGVLGAAQHCFDVARRYTLDRKQFNKPLAANELIQTKLADMTTDITMALQGCYRAARLKDEGKLSHEIISMMKRNSTEKALKCARMARDMLGGNGIVDEYHVMRHACNLESVITYEGTYDIHGLIIGRAITGIASF